MDQTLSQALVLEQVATGETILALASYGSLEAANIYFDNKLHSTLWRESTNDDKKRALTEATRLIDNLKFVGAKTDPTQLREFPRDGEPTPRAIEIACYELAFQLLDGVDVEQEIANLTAESQGYASVRTTYNRSFVPDYVRAGIPSVKAWNQLKPYLKDPNSFEISRV